MHSWPVKLTWGKRLGLNWEQHWTQTGPSYFTAQFTLNYIKLFFFQQRGNKISDEHWYNNGDCREILVLDAWLNWLFTSHWKEENKTVNSQSSQYVHTVPTYTHCIKWRQKHNIETHPHTHTHTQRLQPQYNKGQGAHYYHEVIQYSKESKNPLFVCVLTPFVVVVVDVIINFVGYWFTNYKG